MRAAALAALTALTLAAAPMPAQQVNTTTGGTDYWLGFGWGFGDAGAITGVGQRFVAPGSVLSSFSIYLDYASGPAEFIFRAFVGAWDGTEVTGVLWDSGDLPAPTLARTSTTLGGYTPYTFAPNLAVTSGAMYLAYVYPVSTHGGVPDRARWATRSRELSVGVADGLGGTVIIQQSEGEPVQWHDYYPYDQAFVADFTTVPEPATLLLLVPGLLGIAVARRRRQA